MSARKLFPYHSTLMEGFGKCVETKQSQEYDVTQAFSPEVVSMCLSCVYHMTVSL